MTSEEFRYCKIYFFGNVNYLQNLKLGVIVKYLSLIPGAIPEKIDFKF